MQMYQISGMQEHVVCLTVEARGASWRLAYSGSWPAQMVVRAQVLLKSDASLTNDEIADDVGLLERTVAEIR